MTAFNKLYILTPSWKKDEIINEVGGTLIIYAEDYDNFREILTKQLDDCIYYIKSKEHPSILGANIRGNVFYIINGVSAEDMGFYWHLVKELECIMPNVEFGIIEVNVVEK